MAWIYLLNIEKWKHLMLGTSINYIISPIEGITIPDITNPAQSMARNWMELLLESIRHDYTRPNIHARNLFHSSFLMYEIWAAYQNISKTLFLGKTLDGYTCNFNGIPFTNSVNAEWKIALSFAIYRF